MILQCTLASSPYDIYPCLSFLDKFFFSLTIFANSVCKEKRVQYPGHGTSGFAIRLVDSLASLPHRQVKLFGKFKLL